MRGASGDVVVETKKIEAGANFFARQLRHRHRDYCEPQQREEGLETVPGCI